MSREVYIPLIAGVVSFIVFFALGMLTNSYLRRK